MTFCTCCATRLGVACPRCQLENPPDASFCGGCAAALESPANAPGRSGGRADVPPSAQGAPNGASAATQRHVRAATEGERRRLTVMFCDIVDSTAIAERLDPEDLRDVLRDYQARCAAVIARHGGHLAKFLGDGVLAYFGYPIAHEDDGARAARAALEIVREMHGLRARMVREHEVDLAVRVAIHTGIVVAGEMGGGAHRESLAIVGEAPNVAARLQSVAAPNEVVASAATFELIRGLFDCEPLGFRDLKGVRERVGVYRIRGETGARSRLETVEPARLTALVGRTQEIAVLETRWEEVRARAGRVVIVSGEAGIGKSRLVRVLADRIGAEPHTWLEAHCSPYFQSSAFRPFIDLLQRRLGCASEAPAAERLAALESMLDQDEVRSAEGVAALAAVIGRRRAADTSLTTSPARQKQQTLDALLGWIAAAATVHPVVLVIEDLHWIDPSTLELLTLLIDREPSARVLTILTCRPEFRPSWAMHGHLTHLVLSRLGRDEARTMIARVAGARELPAGVLGHLVARADGIPLFVEELTRTVLDGNEAASQAAAIPATLHDSLTARLDRLTEAKPIAQLAAVLGREFRHELLEAVAPWDDTRVRAALDQLVESDLVQRRGVPPHATYVFKHALILEAAYQSLLRSTRQEYHQRIARALADRFSEVAELTPELIAYHYTEAGCADEAINQWYAAGARAVQRAANPEAVAYLTRAIELLQGTPATAERIHRELALRILLGVALMSWKGYAAPDVESAFGAARALCDQLGEAGQPFPALRGLWAFAIVRGRLAEARTLADQLFAIATASGDAALLLEAHYALACTLFYVGEFAASLEHAERGVALYDPALHQSHTLLYGADPAMSCSAYASWALWFLGYPDRALARSRDACAYAEATGHPVNIAFALGFRAVVHQLRGEVAETRAAAEATIAIAEEQGLSFWSATGDHLLGWALLRQGHTAESEAASARSLRSNRTAGADIALPACLGLLAEVRAECGDREGALAAIADALMAADHTGALYLAPELQRLRGELLLRAAPASEEDIADAEACFRRGLAIARGQQSRSMELRCATSLARILERQGRGADERQELAARYASITEGRETADLRAARAALGELA
jgi:class 3 adenylate cyclase/predicted ATPase